MTEQEVRYLNLNILPRKIEMKDGMIFLYALACLSPFITFYSIMLYQGSMRGFFQISAFSLVFSLIITVLIRAKRFWKSHIYLRDGQFIVGKIVDSEFCGRTWYWRFTYEYAMIIEYDFLGKRVRIQGPIVTGKPKTGSPVFLLVVKENPEYFRFLLHDSFSASL
jgi:hypothetical protein